MKKIYFLLLVFSFITNANAQIVNIPDANFKAKLLAANTTNSITKNLLGVNFKIDANSDGEIQETEALQVSYLAVASSRIASLVGIEKFINIQTLDCSYNQLTSIDVITLQNLKSLACGVNQLTTLNLSGLTNLNSIFCSGNQISTLDVGNFTNLKYLSCSGNQLTYLDVSILVNLQQLECSQNRISILDVSSLANLRELVCSSNKISTLDVSKLIKLLRLECRDNQISTLDITNLSRLQTLWCQNNLIQTLNISSNDFFGDFLCHNNKLETVFIKNGVVNERFYFKDNPALKYICCDESEIDYIQYYINDYGYTNCVVNSYCSFVPGGTFYTIQGNQKLDSNNNGCDVNDVLMPNLKYTITNGTTTGSLISNTTGNYSIPVQAGTHTITPVLENPTYFTVLPTIANVSFPTQTSPFVQDLCITANGVHPDLEVTLLPLRPAVPGFDSKYKLVYKNKGNTIQSGSVNLNFNDAVLDLVVANPITTTQSTNNLSWNFSNLLPFETREITFTLNVNSPLETPAVNSGSVLAFNATITTTATDETPIDNSFAFNQIVVNSFDPNDKTCLEGTTISPSLIGQYVHYMIRFENNGTANAQNIVVKDMIDLSKFDISTLVPTNASNSFVTNITAGNKVEFIFQNINLPFDDDNNDGYIAFKIKTLPTLVVNDTFTNDASIYFDYNFPIVTQPASSTFKTLAIQDFEFANYFTLYPNPAKSVLNINSKETIEVKSISIYNALGQLVLVIPNAEKVSKIDVSSLTTGNYFIKINSNMGTSNARFIKE